MSLVLIGCGGGAGGGGTPQDGANAGVDQNASAGALITLNGGASSSADGTIVSFAWVQTQGPAVELTGADSSTATFVAPAVAAITPLAFKLTVVNDKGVESVDIVQITINGGADDNQIPTANAGADLTVNSGTVTTLDASSSADADGTIASYSWTQTQGPAVALTGANSISASFTAPTVTEAATLVFQLEVTDDKGASNIDLVQVNVTADKVKQNFYGSSFVVNGVTYSPSPVLDGTATGFSYPLIGAGYSDGESAGAHVWYGKDNCLSFRNSGFGVLDKKGGTAATTDSFPWVMVEFYPGGFITTMTLAGRYKVTPVVGYLPDPNYDRRSELLPFQWGVRLKSDGSVYTDSKGYYEFYLKFDDGSSMRAAWNPLTNAPATDASIGKLNLLTGEVPFSNALRGYTTDLPSTGHFCTFRETASITLEPRCVETAVNYSGGTATRKLCYAKGMLNGDYTLTSQYGKLLETGRFADNRPSEGWTFWRDDGTLWASGIFNGLGVHAGVWEYHDPNSFYSSREDIPFSGVLTPSAHNTFYTRLDGSYKKYQEGQLSREGHILEGHEEGWWKSYNVLVVPSRLKTEELYDSATQIPTGQRCWPSSGDCVTMTSSLVKTRVDYVWYSCFGSYRSVKNYSWDGSFISEACNQLTGTPENYGVGAPRACPSVSCQ